MMTQLLSDLIQGRLSSIGLGMSTDDVERLLGPPDTKSEGKRPARIWKYGDLELSFSGNKLFLIAMYLSTGSPRLPSALEANGRDLAKFSLSDMRSQLDREGLTYVIDEKLTFDDQVGLRAGKITTFIFTGKGETKDIHSIQLSESVAAVQE
jgi:hypothetical protein